MLRNVDRNEFSTHACWRPGKAKQRLDQRYAPMWDAVALVRTTRFTVTTQASLQALVGGVNPVPLIAPIRRDPVALGDISKAEAMTDASFDAAAISDAGDRVLQPPQSDGIAGAVQRKQAEEVAAFCAPYSCSFTRGIRVDDIRRPHPDKFLPCFFCIGGRSSQQTHSLCCSYRIWCHWCSQE